MNVQVKGEFMQKLTIYEISKLAGVSITTVSRVLNGQDNVKLETKKRVEEVVQKYNYIPRQTARNFVKTNMFAVGLLMDDIRHAYMSELAYAINQELGIWKIDTIVCNIPDISRGFINQIDNLIDKRVNGVILLGSIFENEICKVSIERRYSALPFVTVNANIALPNVREILQDQFQGTRDAVKYLYKHGRTRIGWIYYHKSHSDKKKNEGFLHGLQECGLIGKRLYETKEKSLDEGKRATMELLKRFPDTDAIIYSSDSLAVGGVHYLNSHQIPVPDQIAVIGFNNSRSAIECYPPLTSIDNRVADSGKKAAQTMLNILNNCEVEKENYMLTCDLKIRQSTP